MATPMVSDEAACPSLQPFVCTQETINKEGISWTIAAGVAQSTAWELVEVDRRREGWREGTLEEDEEGKEFDVEGKGEERKGTGDQSREPERGIENVKERK